MPRRIIQSNHSFSCAPVASNEITDNNSRLRHTQSAITWESGHTNAASSVTSEGAHALTESLSPQLVPKRLLRHGHCPHGHRPRESPLVPASPSQCSYSHRHQKGNVVHGTYERPPPTTTLETRFWQRIRTPIPRHSRHFWNQHMCFYQTRLHPKRQKDHLRQKVCDNKPHKKEKE
jgi:hypothetical protein